MTLQLVLWIIATVLLVVATFAPAAGTPRFSVLSAGLAFLAAGFVAGAV